MDKDNNIDYLYSRKRFRLNKNHVIVSRIDRIKLFLILLFVICLISIILFLKISYPTFKASCELTALSEGNKIIINSVSKIMKDYNYNSFIKIEKDINGNVAMLEIDSYKINQVVNSIIADIQNEFDNIPRLTVPINLGTVTGISFLSRFDPRFSVTMESSGKIYSNIKSEFEAKGINQTEHKLFLELNGIVSILTPIQTFSKDINERVLLTEAIIVGEVPSSFYEFDSVTNDDLLNFAN